ncbi:MAG: hypothetical protein SNJ69_18105, partial [Chloroflexaceae bacterium]
MMTLAEAAEAWFPDLWRVASDTTFSDMPGAREAWMARRRLDPEEPIGRLLADPDLPPDVIAALEAVADNVANAATPGYVRRVPNLGTTPGGGALSPLERDLLTGNGVQLAGLARATDLLRADSLRRAEGDVLAL